MDDTDFSNFLVLGIFVAGMVVFIVGYFLAWRSKRPAYRKTGSLMTGCVVGFAGFCMLMWLIGAIMPLPPPDGSPLWEPLLFLLMFSPLPLGAFYMCAKFIRQAIRDEPSFKL